jgi:hypothetical protein
MGAGGLSRRVIAVALAGGANGCNLLDATHDRRHLRKRNPHFQGILRGRQNTSFCPFVSYEPKHHERE